MRTRILSIVMTVLMMIALVPTALAATTDEINQPEVFLKQESNGTCTLASTAMMLRRTAMLRGDQDWDTITEASCREAFWIGGLGLPYQFEYDGITVDHARLPGGEENYQILVDLLAEHPEGIVLHARCVPHGILLTDYTDGVFYCADPAQNVALGRVTIEEAHGTRIENADACWFVTSPDVAVEETEEVQEVQDLPVLPEPSVAPSSSPLSHFLGLTQEEETAGCLIAQAMAAQARV